MLQWISSFLHDRTQCTKVGNCQSSLSKVISISGVPQGSVLGPLLFLLFINDLPSLFGDLTVKMFADDVKIYLVVGDIDSSSVLQCGLDALFDWSLKWQLSVSAKTCVMLQLSHSNKHFKYNINNLVLPNVTEVKDLSIIVDHELKFKRHIQDITTRAHQ